ncbi:GNAT family N-acetyltransferase [Nocardioides dongkuii]|uniref:GNAT family N-acetyltransferase n=1 Tax=Nocardioides dongkuii TaxID=2760089 RepID=UPI0015FAA044|nr:GNAT family N-acetyltransferase [Nocardioides dongkuii]
MTATAFRLELTTDPAAFLAGAADHLAADPVLTTVVASVTARAVAEDERGEPRPDHPRWWVTVRDGSEAVVGVGMRTAPYPHQAYLLPMPEEAAVALARLLHERGEAVGGVNGVLTSATAFAEETARLAGGTAEVHEHMRLWELGALVPHEAPGRLRPATVADVALATEWWNGFHAMAAEMAGRAPDARGAEAISEAELARRVEAGQVWLWEDDGGEVVHLTHANAPAHGVARIGPVLTPREHRRRGYASAAVAGVSGRLLAVGHRACLFTDQANPTSNRIYAAIGYQPVVDMVNLIVRP